MDRQVARSLMARIESTLKKEFDGDGDYGVRIKTGTFGTSLILKVEVMEKTEGGEIITPEMKSYDFHAPRLGLPPRGTKFTVTFSGRTYTLEGYKVKGRKFPILCRWDVDGKLYKFTVDQVKAAVATSKVETEKPRRFKRKGSK